MVRKSTIICVAIVLLTACNHTNEDKVISGFSKVSKPYHSENAIQNGDVVNIHGKYANMDKWNKFIKNVESNKPDKVRITQYSIEGDPIFYELVYDGNIIQYTFDNSMDAFGTDMGRPSTSCMGIGKKKLEQGQEGYVLLECNDSKTRDTFWFNSDFNE
jgi:hypothetical protein